MHPAGLCTPFTHVHYVQTGIDNRCHICTNKPIHITSHPLTSTKLAIKYQLSLSTTPKQNCPLSDPISKTDTRMQISGTGSLTISIVSWQAPPTWGPV